MYQIQSHIFIRTTTISICIWISSMLPGKNSSPQAICMKLNNISALQNHSNNDAIKFENKNKLLYCNNHKIGLNTF